MGPVRCLRPSAGRPSRPGGSQRADPQLLGSQAPLHSWLRRRVRVNGLGRHTATLSRPPRAGGQCATKPSGSAGSVVM